MITLTRDQVAPIHRLPDCALHSGVSAVVDARTKNGQWGYLCRSCFAAFGVGLGTGVGQVLVPVEPPHHLNTDNGNCHSCGAGWVRALGGNGATLRHADDCLYNSAIEAFPDLY